MDSSDSVILESINRLNSARTIKQIRGILRPAIKSLGFNCYYFGLVSELQPNPQFILEIGKYPRFLPEDKDLCFKKVVNPLLLYCLKNTVPFIWDGASFYKNTTNESLSIIEDFVKAHGDVSLPPSILIPINKSYHNLGIFYLWHENKPSLAMQQMISLQPSVIMLTIYTYNALIRILSSQQRTGITLTPRENQCLALCHLGKSYKDMSQELGISKRTVIFHITNLFDKLGANNKIEAINKAKHFGLVDFLYPL